MGMRPMSVWSIVRIQCTYKQAARQLITRFPWKHHSTVIRDEENDEHEVNKVSPSIHALEKQVEQLTAQNKELLQDLAIIAKQKTRETAPINSHQWSPVYQFRDGDVIRHERVCLNCALIQGRGVISRRGYDVMYRLNETKSMEENERECSSATFLPRLQERSEKTGEWFTHYTRCRSLWEQKFGEAMPYPPLPSLHDFVVRMRKSNNKKAQE